MCVILYNWKNTVRKMIRPRQTFRHKDQFNGHRKTLCLQKKNTYIHLLRNQQKMRFVNTML